MLVFQRLRFPEACMLAKIGNVHVLANAVAPMLAKIITFVFRRLRFPRASMLAKISYSCTHASRKHDFFLRLDAGLLESCTKTHIIWWMTLKQKASDRFGGMYAIGNPENAFSDLKVIPRPLGQFPGTIHIVDALKSA